MSRQLATVSIGPAAGWSLEPADLAAGEWLDTATGFHRHLATLDYAADLGRAIAEQFLGGVQATLGTFDAAEAGGREALDLLARTDKAARDLAELVVEAEWVADVAAELVEPITENLTPWGLVLDGVARSHVPRIAALRTAEVAWLLARRSWPPRGSDPEHLGRCRAHRPRGSPTSSPIAFGIPRHAPPAPLRAGPEEAVTV